MKKPEWDRKPVILLVDDQPRNLQLLGSALFNNGYDVAFAGSGPEALDLIAEEPPDLMLLDVMMPGMDGFEVCRKIKSSKEEPEFEIIFVTAKTQNDDILKGFTVGGVDYITKPIQIPEILARVKSHVSLKFARDQLRRANGELSQVIESQQRFLSILSHDVRAPLYGLNHLLAEGVQSAAELTKEDLLEMMKTCEQSSRSLSTFFEDTLVWAQNETGGNAEPEAAISLSDAFFSVRSLLISGFEKKEVRLESQIPAGMAVTCRPNAFATVVRNLLSNAMKYSYPGGKVTFSCERINDRIRVAVFDEGVGLSPEQLSALFHPDSRHSTLGTGSEKGAGMGLILCKSLVEKMGSDLCVESKEGGGSRFYFDLKSA